MNKFMPMLLVFMYVVVACTPSEQAIQTAIAQTQVALPTTLPTSTSAPTLTATLMPSPSPTPDLRIIVVESKEFLLTKADFPIEQKYRTPSGSGWASPNLNYEIVANWGTDLGSKYLEETGRVEGWFVVFLRGRNPSNYPYEVQTNPVRFATTEGAQMAMKKYFPLSQNKDSCIPFKAPEQIGDMTIACTRKGQSNGRYWTQLSFSYRNYTHTVSIYGVAEESSLDYLVLLAKAALAKLQAAPLSEP